MTTTFVEQTATAIDAALAELGDEITRLEEARAILAADQPAPPPSREATRAPRKSAPNRELTVREREVIELLGHGLSVEQIAKRMGISTSGVGYHMRHVRGKGVTLPELGSQSQPQPMPRGRRPVEVLGLIAERPGIEAREIGPTLGLNATMGYQVVKRLREAGQIEPCEKGWKVTTTTVGA